MRLLPLILLAGSLILLAACDASDPGTTDAAAGSSTIALDGAPAAGRGQDKVAVCHYDADAGTYELLNVAAPGAKTHDRQHEGDYVGDDYVGAPVPFRDGYFFDEVFDEACQPESLCPFEGGEEFVGTFAFDQSTVSYPADVTILGCPDPGGTIADVTSGQCSSHFILLEYTDTGFLVQEDGSTPDECIDGYEFDFVYDEAAGSLVGSIVGYLGGPSNLSGTFDLELAP